MSIGEVELNQQKEQLQLDFDKVQQQIQELDNQKQQLAAQSIALQGAMQQCDLFLKQVGDDGNTVSSIPSEDNVESSDDGDKD